MRDLRDQDLFDVLGIGLREDSYTELLANVFQANPDIAFGFLSASLQQTPPPGPVSAHTRVSSGHKTGTKAIPDLVLLFGKPATHAWIIEAKIEAGEGEAQTHRYNEASQAILDTLGAPDVQLIHPSGFLTLDGREPRSGFKAISYRPLCELLDTQTSLDPAQQLAVSCLRERLVDYYAAADEPPRLEASLGDYLGDVGGLITTKDRFTG